MGWLPTAAGECTRAAVKQAAKRFLYRVAPRWATAFFSARARAYSHRVVAGWGCGPVHRQLFAHLGNQVQTGPFAGLVLSPMTHAEQIGPYLLGTYESALADAWATILRGRYAQIIDIGAKFGYYAVGLAKKYPGTPVVAFDTDPWARRAVREMIAANGVGNVQIESFCSADWLERHTGEGALIVSDCEGYEAVLFGPGTAAKLRSATLLVETHDCFAPGVTDQLRATFGETHDVEVHEDRPYRKDHLPPLDFLTPAEQTLATEEARVPQVWLLCLPKASIVGRALSPAA